MRFAIALIFITFSLAIANGNPKPEVATASGDISTPCIMCQSVMEYVDSILQTENIDREDIENALHSVCPMVKDLVDETQCSLFVQQYGDALITFLMNDDGSTTTCVSVGLCNEDATGTPYQILSPLIDPSNTSMTFTVTEKIVGASSVFYYKIFLGGINVDSSHYSTLLFNFSNYDRTSVNLYILDAEGIEYQSSSECEGCDDSNVYSIYSPMNDSWYYLTVNASFHGGLSALAVGHYTLDVVYGAYNGRQSLPNDGFDDDDEDDEDDDDDDEEEHHHMRKFMWVPIAVAVPLAILVCCCCCARRRIRSKYCKKSCAQAQRATQTQEIPLQTPPMYYFVPTSDQVSPSVQLPYYINQRPVQYAYAPMQPVVVPVPAPTAPQTHQ